MSSVGMVRELDRMGRIVIPKEIRKQLETDTGTPLSFFVDESMIVLKKYQPGCVFCGEIEDGIRIHGKPVCNRCRRLLVEKCID
jgi:transcriptional pleiotropic regulator of transition state genes